MELIPREEEPEHTLIQPPPELRPDATAGVQPATFQQEEPSPALSDEDAQRAQEALKQKSPPVPESSSPWTLVFGCLAFCSLGFNWYFGRAWWTTRQRYDQMLSEQAS